MAKRKITVRKPYNTKKRKEEKLRKEFRSMVATLCSMVAFSALVAFAETTNSFNIYGDSAEKTNARATPVAQPEAGSLVVAKEEGSEIAVAPQALEIDYSNIPYIEKTKGSVKEQIGAIAKVECSRLQLGGLCVQDTLGIAWAESRFDCGVKGDNGNSHGCFQIYRVAHPEVTTAQAKDIEFATKWTVNNLAAHGYAKNRDRAIRMHNGDPTIAKTLAYLATVKSFKN